MTFKNDYDDIGLVKLNKEIFDVLLITEKSTIALNNADIHQLYFIEDIFKFCLTGTMTFNDRYNLMEYGPFTGNEKLAIVYAVDDKRSRELLFDIWKVGKIQQVGTGINETSENMITMHFVDPFFTGFAQRRFSRSWSDEYYTSIMRDILNNMVLFKVGGRPFNVEQSKNKTDFIIPYWTPQTAMRWLMRRAKGEISGTSGYLCFNNTKEMFSHNLLTMNYLLNDEWKSLDPIKYDFTKGEVSGENKILEWWISGIDRISLPAIKGGIWRGYDFKTKKLLDHEQVYSDAADNTWCLGKKTLYNKIDDNTSYNALVGENNQDLLGNVAYNDWAKRYNMQFIMNLIVQGHDKRYAGQHIQIDWPDSQANLGTASFNSLLKGKYLIKSVTHSFSPGGTFPYKQRLVLIKNAYNDITSEILYQAKKSNVFPDKNVKTIVRGG
jgi:hypothetical protein